MKQDNYDKNNVSRREIRNPLSKFDTSIQGTKEKLDYFMFIIILSSPNGYEKRKAIRETWLSFQVPNNLKVGHRFVIGTSGLDNELLENLFKERNQHGDLLLLSNHEDNYYLLTMKLLKTFIWVKNNVQSNFILKVDDDSFVRTNVLVKDLAAREKFERIYWGFFRGDANVKKIGKWAEKNWILCDKYLPYANGGGYLLSQDLVNYMAKISDMLQIYNNEDVAVGKGSIPLTKSNQGVLGA